MRENMSYLVTRRLGTVAAVLRGVRRPWLHLLFCLAACEGGQGGTPQPDPPGVSPIDPDRLRTLTARGDPPSIELRGEPGAVKTDDSERLTLSVVNLDAEDAVAMASVDEDGSFRTSLGAAVGHELRLQVFEGPDDREGSPPLDVVHGGGEFTPAPRPLSCLEATPAAQLVFDPQQPGSAEITLTNGCGGAVSVSARLRLLDGEFTAGRVPETIADGATETIRIDYAPAGDGAGENHLLVTIERDAVRERRPFTLRGDR